jgi:SPP1 family predicted phage head-tail adaptor
VAQAGKFRERAAFQRLRTTAPDEYGNIASEWRNLFSRSVDVIERPGSETIEGGSLSATNTATMRVRSCSLINAVTTADRVILRGVTWDIEGDLQVDRKGAVVEFALRKGVAA